MPPKKKGIAKPKKAPSRRSTRKKATKASGDDAASNAAPAAAPAPAPIRVNTDPSNRQRTRARVAAAKGTKEISPVLPVELGADPDEYAKRERERAKGGKGESSGEVAEDGTADGGEERGGEGEGLQVETRPQIAAAGEEQSGQQEASQARPEQEHAVVAQYTATAPEWSGQDEAPVTEPQQTAEPPVDQAQATPTPPAETEKERQLRADEDIRVLLEVFQEHLTHLQGRANTQREIDLTIYHLSAVRDRLLDLHRIDNGDVPVSPGIEAYSGVLAEWYDPAREERMRHAAGEGDPRDDGLPEWMSLAAITRTPEQEERYQRSLTEDLIHYAALRHQQRPVPRYLTDIAQALINHRAGPPGSKARRFPSSDCLIDLRDETLDRRDIPRVYDEVASGLLELRALPGNSSGGVLAVFQEELLRARPLRAKINTDGDTEEDHQLRMLSRRIDKYHKHAQTEAEFLTRPRNRQTLVWDEIDLDGAYTTLTLLQRDLEELHRLRGDVDLPAEMKTYKTALAETESIGQRVRAKEEEKNRKHAEWLAKNEQKSPVEEQQAPAANAKPPVAKQQFPNFSIHSPTTGDKRQRSSSGAEDHEDASKRQKSDQEDAKLQEFLDSTHDNAVKEHETWAAAAQAPGDVPATPNADQPVFGADFPARQSTSVTIKEDDDDNDMEEELFGEKNNDHEVPEARPETVASPSPIVSPIDPRRDSVQSRNSPVSPQATPATSKPIISPAVARLQTSAGNAPSPASGGSPVIRYESLPWVPKTPSQHNSPANIPSVPQATGSSPRHVSVTSNAPVIPDTDALLSSRNPSLASSATKSPPNKALRDWSRGRYASSQVSPKRVQTGRSGSSGSTTSRAYVPPPASLAEETEHLPARASLTQDPAALNRAIQYNTNGSTEFALHAERRPGLASADDAGDDAGTVFEQVEDKNEELDDNDIDALAKEWEKGVEKNDGAEDGGEVQPGTSAQVVSEAAGAPSLEELLAKEKGRLGFGEKGGSGEGEGEDSWAWRGGGGEDDDEDDDGYGQLNDGDESYV